MDQMEPPKEDFSVGPLSVLSESVKKNCQVVPAGGRWVVLSAGSFVGTRAGVERRSEYKGAGGPSRGEAVPHRCKRTCSAACSGAVGGGSYCEEH
jgi:hypothetical protein